MADTPAAAIAPKGSRVDFPTESSRSRSARACGRCARARSRTRTRTRRGDYAAFSLSSPARAGSNRLPPTAPDLLPIVLVAATSSFICAIRCRPYAAAGTRGNPRAGSTTAAGPTSDDAAREPVRQDDWDRYQQADDDHQHEWSHDEHYPRQREGKERKRKDSQADRHVVDLRGDFGRRRRFAGGDHGSLLSRLLLRRRHVAPAVCDSRNCQTLWACIGERRERRRPRDHLGGRMARIGTRAPGS